MPEFNAAFWAWFGDSVVRNEDGTPKVVYHGTGAQFHEFKPQVFLGLPHNQGVFSFSDSHLVADSFGPRIIPAFLSIQNPADYRNANQIAGIVDALYGTPLYELLSMRSAELAGSDEVVNTTDDRKRNILFATSGDYGFFETHGMVDVLKALGFDGWITTERGGTAYGAFYPTQIKSIDNDGTWDADDPNIGSNPDDFWTGDQLSRDVRGSVFELPEGTLLYHGSPEPYASQIRKHGKLTWGHTHKPSAGSLNEGGLIFFATDRRIADRYARRSETGREIEGSGSVFVYRLSGPILVADYYMRLNQEQADILNRMIPLPDYKALREGDQLRAAAYRAHELGRVRDRYPSYRTEGGEMMVIWPAILKALGFDAYAYENSQIAIPAESLSVVAGNPPMAPDAVMQLHMNDKVKFDLRSLLAEAEDRGIEVFEDIAAAAETHPTFRFHGTTFRVAELVIRRDADLVPYEDWRRRGAPPGVLLSDAMDAVERQHGDVTLVIDPDRLPPPTCGWEEWERKSRVATVRRVPASSVVGIALREEYIPRKKPWILE